MEADGRGRDCFYSMTGRARSREGHSTRPRGTPTCRPPGWCRNATSRSPRSTATVRAVVLAATGCLHRRTRSRLGAIHLPGRSRERGRGSCPGCVGARLPGPRPVRWPPPSGVAADDPAQHPSQLTTQARPGPPRGRGSAAPAGPRCRRPRWHRGARVRARVRSHGPRGDPRAAPGPGRRLPDPARTVRRRPRRRPRLSPPSTRALPCPTAPGTVAQEAMSAEATPVPVSQVR